MELSKEAKIRIIDDSVLLLTFHVVEKLGYVGTNLEVS